MDEKLLCSIQKHRYPNPPSAVIPAPHHHNQSAFLDTFFSNDTSRFKDVWISSPSSRSRFALAVLVDLAPTIAEVGFRVCVGSIWGGLKAIYMGLRGASSKA